MFVLMKHSNRFSAAVFMLSLYGCGGGGSTAATPSPGPQTTTFMGSARTAANGGCSGNAHIVDAGQGTLTVTLTQAGAPRMQLQVCSTSEADHRNCTVPPFVLLPVGQSVSATVKGARPQSVTVFTEGCGGPTATPTDPIAYSISVVHPG